MTWFRVVAVTRFVLIMVSTLATAAACHGIQPGEPWEFVRKDSPVDSAVVRVPYIPLDRLQLTCLHAHGIFTPDQAACMVQRRGVCYYVTAPGDVAHDEYLNALCNGFTPD